MSQQALEQPPLRRSHLVRSSRSRLQWLFGVIIGILLLFLLFQCIRIGIPLQKAYQQGKQFAQIMRGDLSPESYALAQQSLQESADAIGEANSNFSLFAPLLHRMHWLPWIGNDLTILPTLATAGHQLSELAVTGMEIAKPILLTSKGTSPLTQLPAVYAAAEPEMAAILEEINRINNELQSIDTAQLSLLHDPVKELQAATSLMAPGLRLGASLSSILGVGETRTYLVLAQNNHELRATGGFLTAIGRISLLDGKVVSIEFMDSYDPSISRTDLPLPQAPEPVQKHMNIGVMLLRDANWSPDFPTTAQIVRTIYSQQTGRMVDGVITIDLQAVQLFVQALEPLKMAGVEEPLTGETVLEQLTAFWAAPLNSDATIASGDAGWWKQRKDFIPKLVDAVLGRVLRGQFDYLRMLSTTQTALDQRAVQLWFSDPTIQKEVAAVGWDGSLRLPDEGDFLAIVDTNFGYNKVNAAIEQRVGYQVSWPEGPSAPAVATVSIVYEHPFERTGYLCDQTPHYEGSYEEMIVRCYFDYLRVYVPQGSELLGVQGLQTETVVSQRSEGGSQLFGGYFILNPGSETTIALQYRLPADITPEEYKLTVRRQSGTKPLSFQADVNQRFIEKTIESGLFVWQP